MAFSSCLTVTLSVNSLFKKWLISTRNTAKKALFSYFISPIHLFIISHSSPKLKNHQNTVSSSMMKTAESTNSSKNLRNSSVIRLTLVFIFSILTSSSVFKYSLFYYFLSIFSLNPPLLKEKSSLKWPAKASFTLKSLKASGWISANLKISLLEQLCI